MTAIDEYIHEAPAERRAALTRLRTICQSTLAGYLESMDYGMPTYMAPGAPEAEIAFASQKRHIALYVLKQPVLDRFRDEFPTSRVGKGCIRYSNVKQIDFELVEAIVRRSFTTDSEIC